MILEPVIEKSKPPIILFGSFLLACHRLPFGQTMCYIYTGFLSFFLSFFFSNHVLNFFTHQLTASSYFTLLQLIFHPSTHHLILAHLIILLLMFYKPQSGSPHRKAKHFFLLPYSLHYSCLSSPLNYPVLKSLKKTQISPSKPKILKPTIGS